MKALYISSTHKVLCDLLPVLSLIVSNKFHQQQIFIFIPVTFARIATVGSKLQRSLRIQLGAHFSVYCWTRGTNTLVFCPSNTIATHGFVVRTALGYNRYLLISVAAANRYYCHASVAAVE